MCLSGIALLSISLCLPHHTTSKLSLSGLSNDFVIFAIIIIIIILIEMFQFCRVWARQKYNENWKCNSQDDSEREAMRV